jgi:hypothetical protein
LRRYAGKEDCKHMAMHFREASNLHIILKI